MVFICIHYYPTSCIRIQNQNLFICEMTHVSQQIFPSVYPLTHLKITDSRLFFTYDTKHRVSREHISSASNIPNKNRAMLLSRKHFAYSYGVICHFRWTHASVSKIVSIFIFSSLKFSKYQKKKAVLPNNHHYASFSLKIV